MPSNIDLQKLIQLYKSGRFECDIWFHENLLQMVKDLEVFESIPTLQQNLQHVKKIHMLIEQNSDSLNDQFDEEKAVEKAQQIKREIKLIKTAQVKEIISHLERQSFKSYTQHCAQLIKKYNHHPRYVEAIKNIINTVYDPKIRLEYIMICTLFMLRNTNKVDDILVIYEKAISNGLNSMKQFRKKLPNCKSFLDIVQIKFEELSENENDEELKKYKKLSQEPIKIIKKYLQGTYFIYTTLHKLCDIVKILQQKSNFTLKLNSFKPQVQQISVILKNLQNYEEQNPIQVEKRMQDLPIEELKRMFLGEKIGVQKINRCCRICLRCVNKEDSSNGAQDYHKICQEVIKSLINNTNGYKQ